MVLCNLGNILTYYVSLGICFLCRFANLYSTISSPGYVLSRGYPGPSINLLVSTELPNSLFSAGVYLLLRAGRSVFSL